MTTHKCLILRLSSLGDIILAASTLEVFAPDQKVDWVIAKEFSGILKGHQKLNNLIEFDRRAGRQEWVKLCKSLWQAQYTDIFDLHRTLRTRLMKLLFLYWSIREARAFPNWKTVSKQRIRYYGYLIFKKFWPKRFCPSPWGARFTKRVGGTGQEKASFQHLISHSPLHPSPHSQIPLFIDRTEWAKQNAMGKKYLCVMPSSHWEGKNWPVHYYSEVLAHLPFFPIILGSKKDRASLDLCRRLEQLKIPYYSGVGLWSLQETAVVMAGSVGFLGGDTGLAHLAESLGVPTKVIFGPTSSFMGFGPRLEKSQPIEFSLWCRPCSKTGQKCYRPVNKYKCLKDLSPERVLNAFRES